MSLFSSNRERRLWIGTFAVVAAIYATLGLGSLMVGVIRSHAFAVIGFVSGMFLVALTVLLQGLKARPRGLEIAVIVGIATVYFLVFLRMTLSERSHLIEFGVLAVFFYEALLERRSHGRRVSVPFLWAIVATSMIGVVDECLQRFLPSRVFDPVDILFNFLAALMAVTASATVGWVRRRVLKRRSAD